MYELEPENRQTDVTEAILLIISLVFRSSWQMPDMQYSYI